MLKVTKIKPTPDSEETVTCTKNKDSAGFADACTGAVDSATVGWKVVADNSAIRVSVSHENKETHVFRCDVTIDSDASDSKLVTSEAIGK